MKLRLRETEIVLGYEAVAAMTAALLLDKEGRLVCCFLAAILHECGHLVMLLCFRCHIKSVALRLFDVKIVSDQPKNVKEDVLITAAGVTANFLFAAVCCPFSKKLCIANCVIGCFNLLPMESLDGGRMLSLWLSRKFSDITVGRVLKILTFIFLTPIFCCGIFVLLRTKYNYSLLAVSLYLLTVLFLH